GMDAYKTAYPSLPLVWTQFGDSCPGAGGDVSDGNTRIRTYLWVGLLYEFSGVAFWQAGNTWAESCVGGGAAGHLTNMYLAPEVYGYAHAFSNATTNFDPTAVPVSVTVPSGVRGYVMAGSNDLIG